jgi:carboxymethylenebutenolidase
VAVPEIYHATSTGWVGEYTTPGADEGNRLKVATTVESYDGDSAAALDFLKVHPSCTGTLGTAGFCVGGHLCIRAALVNDGVRAVASWYPTDIHSGDGVCGGLGDRSKDTMNLFHKLPTNNNGDGTEVLMIFGRQDPHVDGKGRVKLYQALTEAGAYFEWLELNGRHAFMRDEGYRYDPMLEMTTMQHAISMFNRKLHQGDLRALPAGEKGTLNAKM